MTDRSKTTISICSLLIILLDLIKTNAFPVRLHVASEHRVIARLAAEALPKRKRKSNTQWVTCSSTTEVTKAINKYAQLGDVVAELGSQLRESSRALCETIGPTGKAILVDIERKFPNEKKEHSRTLAMRRKGDELDFYVDRASFVEIKAFDFWRHALFFRSSSNDRAQYNILVVDVGTVAGNDLDLTCIALIKEFIALNHRDGDEENQCRAVIVKSGSLQSLAKRCHHAQRVISGLERIDSCSHSTHIIGAVGVKQYRETIPFVVTKGDICIELGCHLGTTAVLIDEAARFHDSGGCLGVDLGSHIIKSAKTKYPNLDFEVGDGFAVGALARMKEKYFCKNNSQTCNANDYPIYDVVYVDIGGLSGSEGLLEAVSLISLISNSLSPRYIVIKSLCIRRLASSLVAFSDVRQKEIVSERTNK